MKKEEIRKRRFALDLTQAELAEFLGINRITVVRWETGEITPESPKMLDLAFEALENRRIFDNPKTRQKIEQLKTQTAAHLEKSRQRVRHARIISK